MKIVALAYNWKGLGKDTSKEPFFFFKNPDSIIGPLDEILIPRRKEVWPEVELALRIGPDGKSFDAITVANDVTARNVEGRDVHLAYSKGMDTFLPMGTWKTEFDLDNVWRYCDMYTAVNGVRTQTGRLCDMIWKPTEAFQRISKYMLFAPGDILLSGTCLHHHYPLRDGDMVECDIYTDEPCDIMVGVTGNKVREI